nr:hypothetical protein [Myxococcaceae bacterium]
MLPVEPGPALETCVSGARLVARDDVLGLAAFELETGEVRWSLEADREALLRCDDDLVFLWVAERGLVITARSAAEGTLRWKTNPHAEASWPHLGVVAWREQDGAVVIRWEGGRIWGKG